MVVLNSVLSNLVFVCLAVMLSRGRVWKVPFHKGCTGDIWDVVEVDYLEVQVKLWLSGLLVRVYYWRTFSYSAVLRH